MGLTSSLHIGQSALNASQIALQVTGNNLANAATPGYSRQSALLTALRSEQVGGGSFVGRGVQVSDIRRALDPALQARLRSSVSEERRAIVGQNLLLNLESLTNELTGIDVSSELAQFFNTFSELANNPGATVTQAAVIERGASMSGYLRGLRSDMISQRQQVDEQIVQQVEHADELLTQIATLNVAIVDAEQGQGTDGALRDQRDGLLLELSQLMDITTVELPNGAVNVLIGSQPVIDAGNSRGLEANIKSVDNELVIEVSVKLSQEVVRIDSGSIGGLMENRQGAVQQSIDDLDEIASSLIFEVNRLHALGRPGSPITDLTGTLRLAPADQTRSLNDPANQTLADLPFGPVNGTFQVVISDENGNQTTTTIDVDLDGIDNTGAPGFGDDTSLADIQAALNGVANLNAEITPAGELRLYTDSGYDVSFADDSSGVLATLGMNSYFSGSNAMDIDVREALRNDSRLLVVGSPGQSNSTALAIAQLRESGVESLGGESIADHWLKSVERVAVQTATASTRASALQTVRQSLEAQSAAVSGVSIDEESINLITFQQQYQGAARFVNVVNDLTQVLFSLV
jgi:flagellar hook-associated protein 1 FlgK